MFLTHMATQNSRAVAVEATGAQGGAWQQNPPIKTAELMLPADWEASEIRFVYPVAVKVGDGGRVAVARPIHREYSRTGLRAVWYYSFGEVDALIYLNQNCLPIRHRWTRKAWCSLAPEVCDKIAAVISDVWSKGGDVEEVENALARLQL
jgi:hypothetical protein